MKNSTFQLNTTKMDLKRSPFGPKSPIYFDKLSTTSYRARLSQEAAGPAVFLNALKKLWQYQENSGEALSSLGQATIFNQNMENRLQIAGITVTSHCDQTWLKKEKNYSSFDDTEIEKVRFVRKM
jgi:hypothetical protein